MSRFVPVAALVFAFQGPGSCSAPPTVTGTEPQAGASVVAPRVIKATFSQPMDPASITAQTFLVREGGQVPVEGVVTYEGLVASFTPLQALRAGKPYAASIISAQSLLGVPLATAHDWSFETQAETPVSPTRLSLAGDSACPAVASSSSGAATVVWLEFVATGTRVVASRFEPDRGWQAPLYLTEVGDQLCPAVRMDALGGALVIWQQTNGARTHIWSSAFDRGAWTPQEQVDKLDSGSSTEPQLAMNGSGRAVATWTFDDGTATAKAAFYSVDLGWQPETALEDPLPGLAATPAVAINDSGAAVASWVDRHGGHTLIYASLYQPATGWSVASATASLSPAQYYNSNAIDDAGNVIVTSSRIRSGAELDIYADRFDLALNTWTESPPLDTLAGSAHTPVVVMNRPGTGLAAWAQTSSPFPQVFAAIYAPSAGWTPPIPLGVTESGLRVALNDSAQGIVGWLDARTKVMVSRVEAGVFGASVTLATGCSLCPSPPAVTVDPTGTATIAWAISDSSGADRTVFAIRD